MKGTVLALIAVLAMTVFSASPALAFRPSYWTPQTYTVAHVEHREVWHHRPWHRRQVERRQSIIGGRPHGCPYEYCGCSASLFIFHRIIGALNLAANWLHFPHVRYPEPGDAAVAPSHHHVLVLEHHVRGPYWQVHDGNSGHHLTRDHVRSIAGWTVVDPHRGGA